MKHGVLNIIAATAAAAFLAAAACVTSLAAAPTDYSYLSETFRFRLPWLESRVDDRGRSLSEVRDCGDHYEVTGVSFFKQLTNGNIFIFSTILVKISYFYVF